eukprot:311957-Chlamydomonas_euryale.AAC.3
MTFASDAPSSPPPSPNDDRAPTDDRAAANAATNCGGRTGAALPSSQPAAEGGTDGGRSRAAIAADELPHAPHTRVPRPSARCGVPQLEVDERGAPGGLAPKAASLGSWPSSSGMLTGEEPSSDVRLRTADGVSTQPSPLRRLPPPKRSPSSSDMSRSSEMSPHIGRSESSLPASGMGEDDASTSPTPGPALVAAAAAAASAATASAAPAAVAPAVSAVAPMAGAAEAAAGTLGGSIGGLPTFTPKPAVAPEPTPATDPLQLPLRLRLRLPLRLRLRLPLPPLHVPPALRATALTLADPHALASRASDQPKYPPLAPSSLSAPPHGPAGSPATASSARSTPGAASADGASPELANGDAPAAPPMARSSPPPDRPPAPAPAVAAAASSCSAQLPASFPSTAATVSLGMSHASMAATRRTRSPAAADCASDAACSTAACAQRVWMRTVWVRMRTASGDL